MKLNVYLAMLFILFQIQQAQAQSKAEILTNASVLKLIKAGLDPDIIESKIDLSTCKFDLSGDALIGLKNAGASSGIIKSMMKKMEPQTAVATTTVAATNTSVTKAASSDIPDIELINAVYLYDKASRKVRSLEKHSASMRTQSKALGYGGTNFVLQVPGDKSPVRFSQNEVQSFLVNTGQGPADAFVLFKVEVRRNARQAISTSVGLSGMKGSKGILTTDIKMAKPGIFELIPTSKLEKGEYFFSMKTATNAATSNTDVYAFGVD